VYIFSTITLFLLITTAIQILFKTVALGPGGSDYLALIQEPLFYLCGALFVLQAAVWLAVLRRLPLSRAYPFTSLTVVIMLISGALFFGESINLGNVLGAVVIMAGVIVIAGGQEKQDTRKVSF
jgi:drug/metabolite transporter (DMT)-like permease